MTDNFDIRALGKLAQLHKSDHIFKQGEVDRSIYFVQTGLLKAYYVTLDGKELIKSFIQPGEFIGSLLSCDTGAPSTFYVQCLQDTTVQRIGYDELRNIARSNPQMNELIIRSLSQLAIKKEQREYEFLCLSAPERFALLKQRQPDLVQQLTQNDIARYLGITPVALSRIKQRGTP
ncbi:MAG: Crp/Fnr family transcriptional regulator [Pseudomonadota bacterium]